MASLNDPTGITGTSRAQFIQMLKILYGKQQQDAFHKAGDPVRKELLKRRGTMGGQHLRHVLVTQAPQSAGISRREGFGIPTSRSPTFAQPDLIARDLYSSMEQTGQVRRSAAMGDSVAFARPMEEDMRLLRETFDINLKRKINLGFYDAIAAGASYDGGPDTGTLYGRNSRTSSGEAFWYTGRFFLRNGMSLGFSAAPSGAPTYNQESVTSAAINEVYITALGGTNSSPTLTLDSAPNVDPTTDYLVTPYGSRANIGNPPWTSTPADEISAYAGINGIQAFATDDSVYSALYGLAKSGNDFLKGLYLTNSGTARAFEETLVRLACHRVSDEGTGKTPKMLYQHNSTLREMIAEHDGDRRYMPVQGETGYGQYVVHVGDAALPAYADWMMLPGQVFGFTPERTGWISQSDYGPLDPSSKRWRDGFDRDQTIWHMSGNIECEDPLDQFIIDDIDVDVFAINT